MQPQSPAISPQATGVPLMTGAEFLERHGGDHVELVKGQLRAMPVNSPKHGKICLRAACFLGSHAENHDLGHVTSNDSFVQTHSNPDTIRGADISFFSYERLKQGKVPEGILSVVPDLVVEVRSPWERWIELYAKVADYLLAGVRVVIVLDTPTEAAAVYRQDELPQTFCKGDVLTVPDVLPGFSVPVLRLFE
jgi:Uma2 family endonuclease